MSELPPLNFSAHARLKDIVGRGLIISDNIAIIELIKNSKDAGASRVRIDFRQSGKTEATELVISDDGHGMTLDDIQYKWLNIAYSEKKNTAPKVGAYAGSKGIGRFSCDRLGTELEILTSKRRQTPIGLKVNWTDFEVDDRDQEIGKINLFPTELSVEQFRSAVDHERPSHGTILIIRGLRNEWDADRLRSLRKELERFIIDPDNEFTVDFHHWKYKPKHPINGPIANKIFEELDFRASSIQAEIDGQGGAITFELRHDGDFLFRSTERNPYSELKDIKLTLFYLNQPAKAFFKRRTGYRSVDYGSVFLFLNSFRVFPYGSYGDDWLGIDKRKAQGQRRFFGLREVVGFIQVTDNDDRFEPVSSREGLKRNSAFVQLAADSQSVHSGFDDELVYGFFHKTMRKLEKFVVDGLDWDRIDRTIGEDNDEELLAGNYQFLEGEKPVLETIDSVVRIRSPQAHIMDIDINLRYLSSLAEQETDDYDTLVESLEEKFDGTPIDKLKPSEKRDLSRFISRQAKELAQKNRTNQGLEQKISKATAALKTEQKKRIFAEFESTADQTRIIQLHHQVGLVAGALLKRMDRVVRRYRKDDGVYSKAQLFEVIEASIFEIEKIQNVAKLASKADFDISTNRVREDILQFMDEYLENFKDIGLGWNLRTDFENPEKCKLVKSFRPIELTMLIDNLIDNAGKAGAKRVVVCARREKKQVVIEFVDDGHGLTERFGPDELFDKGITDTSGSGIGLSHARQIVEELKGKISIQDRDDRTGAIVSMEFQS
ncbi:MAG: ATP-binding protein [Pseudomonadota bacterium]